MVYVENLLPLEKGHVLPGGNLEEDSEANVAGMVVILCLLLWKLVPLNEDTQN